jgi:hypothetical protein
MFREGRADMTMYKEALKMQAFNKGPNNLFGYIMKKIFTEPETSKLVTEPWLALNKMLTKEEFKHALKSACELW